ncbi:hypothetical protein [Kitasatospora sp. NPDC094015]|uniref:hypothetical protein n=1 Tax=Kitasatospora sp. NPDC094015 TaxID=3155205 RepID=UPI00331C97BC
MRGTEAELPRAAAFELAVRLAGVTGTRSRVVPAPDGSYRVEAPLPEGLAGDAQCGVLELLREADRFGHRARAFGQVVWAELDRYGSDRPDGAPRAGGPDSREPAHRALRPPAHR